MWEKVHETEKENFIRKQSYNFYWKKREGFKFTLTNYEVEKYIGSFGIHF